MPLPASLARVSPTVSTATPSPLHNARDHTHLIVVGDVHNVTLGESDCEGQGSCVAATCVLGNVPKVVVACPMASTTATQGAAHKGDTKEGFVDRVSEGAIMH